MKFLLHFPRLKNLVVRSTFLNEQHLQQICSTCPQLTLMDIGWSRFAHCRLSTLSNLNNIRHLSLPNSTHFSGSSIYPSLLAISSLKCGGISDYETFAHIVQTYKSLEHLTIGTLLDFVPQNLDRRLNSLKNLNSLNLRLTVDVGNASYPHVARLFDQIDKVPLVALQLSLSCTTPQRINAHIVDLMPPGLKHSTCIVRMEYHQLIRPILPGSGVLLKVGENVKELVLTDVIVTAGLIHRCLRRLRLKLFCLDRVDVKNHLEAIPADWKTELEHLTLRSCYSEHPIEYLNLTPLLASMNTLISLDISDSRVMINELPRGHVFPKMQYLSMKPQQPESVDQEQSIDHVVSRCPLVTPLKDALAHLAPRSICTEPGLDCTWINSDYLRVQMKEIPGYMSRVCVHPTGQSSPWHRYSPRLLWQKLVQ